MFHVKHINNNEIYKKLYKLAIKSAKNGDIPVSSIIIYKEKIIAKGFNNKEKNNNALGHAEINAVRIAEKYIKDWRLNECVLITTLKPCKMCAEVINASRISKVYYILEQDNTDYEYNYEKITENSEFIDKYIRLFNNFFKKLR